ncbi:hypothetical protein FVER53590_29092 [Fusarium verticillioides]|nr:hypothetical protein FVER53590_29092 [Fusarium verticillioides]
MNQVEHTCFVQNRLGAAFTSGKIGYTTLDKPLLVNSKEAFKLDHLHQFSSRSSRTSHLLSASNLILNLNL